MSSALAPELVTPDTTDDPEQLPLAPEAEPESAPESPESLPTDAEGAEAAAPDAGTPVVPATETVATSTPVTFTAMGKVFPIDGATQTPTGDVVIPKGQWETMARTLGHGVQFTQQYTMLRQREAKADRAMKDAEIAGAEKDAMSSTILTALQSLMEQDQDLAAYLGPRLQQTLVEAKYAGAQKKLELLESRGRLSPDAVAEQVQGKIEGVLSQHGPSLFPRIFSDPALRAQLLAKVTAEAGRFTVTGQDGQPDVNWDALEREIKFYESLAPAPRAPSAATAPAKPSGPNAALNRSAAKPAPAPAKSVAQPRPRNAETGQFTNAHPDMPTEFNARKAWIEDRLKRGESILKP